MSLRDQLLKAGLASKKDARRTQQDKRKSDKQAQGALDKKARRRAEQAAKREAADEAKREARRAARLEREQLRERLDRALRVRQVIRAHELKGQGPVRYFHRGLSGQQVHELRVSAGVAQSLVMGRSAVVCENMGNRLRYAVVTEVGASKLRELAPELLVDVSESGDAEPAAAVARDWTPDLRARRATAADIARFRARLGASGGT